MKIIQDMKERIQRGRGNLQERIDRIVKYVNGRLNAGPVQRNRFLLLVITSLLLFDYLLFCYLGRKNIFDIFPNVPLLESKKRISIYVPDLHGAVVKEMRDIDSAENDEAFVRLIIAMVTRGSYYENTAVVIPVDLRLRQVWIQNGECTVDFYLNEIGENVRIIRGAEDGFRKALRRSIMENIPSIKNVIILENGVPEKGLWES